MLYVKRKIFSQRRTYTIIKELASINEALAYADKYTRVTATIYRIETNIFNGEKLLYTLDTGGREKDFRQEVKPVHADELLPTGAMQETEPPKSVVQKTEPLKKITSTNLMLIDKSAFGKIKCSVYSDKQGNILMTREQIGRALGYSDPNDAIKKIHKRNKERLDKFSVIVPFNYKNRVGDKMSPTGDNIQNTVLYTRKGVYEICRFSHQPKADAFYDWVYDLLEALATGQAKIIAQKQTDYWQQLRARSKEEHRALTDMIKIFVKYATAQGSKNARYYYIIFSKLINDITATIDRDNTDVEHLHSIIMAIVAIRKAIADGMTKSEPYSQIYYTCKNRLETLKNWGALALAS